jgi:4-hydroxy 2-oxovalerate aldolase
MNEIISLDCTLRDGGYINNWNFGKKNITKLINHLTDAEIDIIECGYLSNKKPYDSDKSIFDTVERLVEFIPKNRNKSKYVCMINCGEYEVEDIPDYDGTSIDGIRVVFHKNQVKEAVEFCSSLSKKGYMLFIQPMITINYADFELLQLVEDVNKINPYSFYIVDSFGVMKKNDLLRMFYLIDNNLNSSINIGYHSHNNLQLAYSNAQALVELNSKRTRILDSSVFGMGRGAGNLNTELFVQHLNDSLDTSYKVYPLLKIIDETLNKIYSTNYWGYSLPHYLSSSCNCHPNYATYLSEKNTLKVKSINEILALIIDEKKTGFDKAYIEELYLSYQKHNIDDSSTINKLERIFNGKNIVVIAPGVSIEKHYEKVNSIINKNDAITLSVNFIPDNFECDYYFVSNEKRFDRMLDNKDLHSINTKVILTSNISRVTSDKLKINYLDLLNDTDAVRDNSTLMLLKLLAKLNVKKVSLAGLDGYSYDNAQNYAEEDMVLATSNETINDLNKGIAKVLLELNKEIYMEFITPTKYFDHLNKTVGVVRYG